MKHSIKEVRKGSHVVGLGSYTKGENVWEEWG
jgi:hypothetical protein